MLLSLVAASAVISAPQSLPAIEPGSVYGMNAFTTNPEFGMLADKIVVAFPPANMDDLTMHVMKGSEEMVGGGFFATDTPYPTFKVLRFKATPILNFAQPGDYVIEFRNAGSPISKFPFTVKKTAAGDEFNPTVTWDIVTPIDKIGALSYSNTNDSDVWMNAWIAPGREGIAKGSLAKIRISHGGKIVAWATDQALHDQHNHRFGFKMMDGDGKSRAAFSKSDLLKLAGQVTGTIEVGGKRIRTFTWTIEGGKIKPHPRSTTATARPDYWIPRRLAASKEGYQFFHLEEQYWSN